jgi:mono/diheme cytochrome c family protein
LPFLGVGQFGILAGSIAMTRLHGLALPGLIGILGLGALLTSQGSDAKTTYGNFCAMCHGASGTGDGPAAAALDPAPANFTAVLGDRSDEEIAEVIGSGKGTMPAFGAQFSAEQISALVAYLRELSGTESP